MIVGSELTSYWLATLADSSSYKIGGGNECADRYEAAVEGFSSTTTVKSIFVLFSR
jgi:hypothetical protein